MEYSSNIEDLEYVRRRLRKIMFLATHGFYRTVDSDEKLNNRFFLEIIKETYKALHILNQINREEG